MKMLLSTELQALHMQLLCIRYASAIVSVMNVIIITVRLGLLDGLLKLSIKHIESIRNIQ